MKGIEENKDMEYDIEDVDRSIEEEEIQEIDVVCLMGDLVRFKSSQYTLMRQEEFSEELDSINQEDILPNIGNLKMNPEYKDIYTIVGGKATYLFSDKYIKYNYAEVMIKTEEKDLIRLMVDTVRNESKTYPRPTDSKLFSHEPFAFIEGQFESVLEQVKMIEEYNDIKECRASNNALYLYSDKFMLENHAKALTEWIEVKQHESP